MRGKGDTTVHYWSGGGITSAHAGKRYLGIISFPEVRDHPRPCGEKRGAAASRDGSEGSPPPMRGKVVKLTATEIAERITPAHAGKRREGHDLF